MSHQSRVIILSGCQPFRLCSQFSLFLNIVSKETSVLHCITALCTLKAVNTVSTDQPVTSYFFSIFKMEYYYQMKLMIARGLSPRVMTTFFLKI